MRVVIGLGWSGGIEEWEGFGSISLEKEVYWH